MSRVWLKNRGNIGRHEVFAVAQAHHYRRPGPRGHNLIRVFAGNYAQREHAGQLPHGVAHGILQIAVVVLLDQMRDDLGVGLGDELVAFLHQLMLERQIILDDAVVHHHDIAVAIAVRMRVFFRRPPMRGPARVPDPVEALHRAQLQDVFQIAQFALSAAHSQAADSRARPARPSHSRGIPAASGRPG